MNLWHDIEPGSADEMNVIVETPTGSRNKYEIDKETGLIALDRALPARHDFPCEYGFIPRTLWDDGDAIDVVILSTFPVFPGILVHVRPVGLMNMIDTGEADDKVIGVPVNDIRWNDVKDLADLNPHTLKEIELFFTTYKRLQDKEVIVTGFKDRKAAIEAFERGQKIYREKFPKA